MYLREHGSTVLIKENDITQDPGLHRQIKYVKYLKITAFAITTRIVIKQHLSNFNWFKLSCLFQSN
jgi:hypothetical protein